MHTLTAVSCWMYTCWYTQICVWVIYEMASVSRLWLLQLWSHCGHIYTTQCSFWGKRFWAFGLFRLWMKETAEGKKDGPVSLLIRSGIGLGCTNCIVLSFWRVSCFHFKQQCQNQRWETPMQMYPLPIAPQLLVKRIIYTSSTAIWFLNVKNSLFRNHRSLGKFFFAPGPYSFLKILFFFYPVGIFGILAQNTITKWPQ